MKSLKKYHQFTKISYILFQTLVQIIISDGSESLMLEILMMIESTRSVLTVLLLIQSLGKVISGNLWQTIFRTVTATFYGAI